MADPSQYDLFISYADADRAWVEGYLFDALEKAGVRFHSEAAFALGVPRLQEFERAIKESQRTLLVCSPALVVNGFTQFTELLAQNYGLETDTWRVIVLKLRPVELPPRLAVLTALDATAPTDHPRAIERLCAELRRPGPGPSPRLACPYLGMDPFREADSDRFFGRDREADELLQCLNLHRFLAVIGPSGSGKSSLVFAGLIPALRRSGLFGPGQWLVLTLRPGKNPLTVLADALGGDPTDPGRVVSQVLAAQPDTRRLLLVVDQFEELYTVAHSDAAAFQHALRCLTETPGAYVVVTARADFYPDLMSSPLWPEIRAHRVEVVPLDEGGLRQAIVRPAESAGVFVEEVLVERLIADAVGEPGVLPLIQETLKLLWERLDRRFLPLRAYEALTLTRGSSGTPGGERTGLQVAMARRADTALAALQTTKEQAIARRIFLRLVQFNEGRPDTRRQQTVAELGIGSDPDLFQQTLHHLASCRLVTLGGDLSGDERTARRSVDLAHEALIYGWTHLRQWIDADRAGLLTHRQLTETSKQWDQHGRDDSFLYRGVRLAAAWEWDRLHLTELSPLEGEFLQTSWRRSRKRQLALVATVVLVIAVLGGLATYSAIQQGLAQKSANDYLIQKNLAEKNEETAKLQMKLADEKKKFAEEQQGEAERQTRIATAHRLAVQANAVGGLYPRRSLLLAAEAVQLSLRAQERPITVAQESLCQALGLLGGKTLVGPHEDAIYNVAISPDGHWLAVSSSRSTVRLCNLKVTDPTASPVVLQGQGGIDAMAFSPDGRWLATGSDDKTVRLWDLKAKDPSNSPVVLHGHEGGIHALAISSDGRWLATGSEDKTVRLWDLKAKDPRTSPVVVRVRQEFNWWPQGLSLAISPDGRWLATAGGKDKTARLWDLKAKDPDAAPVVLDEDGFTSTLAISPDGHWLAVGCSSTVRLWDLKAEAPVAKGDLRYGLGGRAIALAFSPDGRWLATGGDDKTVRLWDLKAKDPAAEPVVLRGHEREILALAISPGGRWLATASADWTSRLWEVGDRYSSVTVGLSSPEHGITALAISPDGRWLATGSNDNTARLWDLKAKDPAAAPVILRGHEDAITALAISPDGRWLATGSIDKTARLWDLKAKDVAPAPVVLRGHWGVITALAISPDGRWLATGCYFKTVRRGEFDYPLGPEQEIRLWDVKAEDPGASPVVLRGPDHEMTDLAIGPDSRWLAIFSTDGVVRLCNLAAKDPAAAPLVVLPGQERISTMVSSSDGRWLATGGFDKMARLWDLKAKDPTVAPVVLRGHEGWIEAMAISLDGRWMATGSADKTARLWDLTAKDPAAAPIVLRGHEAEIHALAISPDGRWLATSSDDKTARLWDLTDKDPAAAPIVLRGHEKKMRSLAISPDSRWLASISADRTARLWYLQADDLLKLASVTVGRNMTLVEWDQYFHGQPYRKTFPDLPGPENSK